jgi:hypothetical protein
VSTDGLVGTSTRVRPDELHTFHRNARRGNLDVIAESLKEHSQYRPIVVNIGTYTGRPNEVLAGNHTLMAIRRLSELEPGDPRWNTVAVYWGDWDEDTCTKIVLADNRTSEVGGMDFVQLKELLESLPDIAGTGYTDLDLTALSQSLDGLADLSSPLGDGDDPDLNDGDGLARLSLKLEPETARRWSAHRKVHKDDTAALLALLSKVTV